jgi:hypothetical protein
LGGLGVALVGGLVFLLVGLLKPGKVKAPESAGGAGKPMLAEAKKKSEAMRKGREKLEKEAKEWAGLGGEEGEHRVFVSSQLVYLPDNAEPVQPLDRKMKTEDGIEVGWKMGYGFNPADPAVKDEDGDGDGFTNLEEYLAKTDPTNKESSPAKESKLKSRSGDPVAMAVSFPEKSGGTYSVRFQVGKQRRNLRVKPGDSLWVMAGPEGVEVFAEETAMKAGREKAKGAGKNSHVIPVKVVSYEEKLEMEKDARAGGVESQVDNSVLVLERKDALAGTEKLAFSTADRRRELSWDVGEIRFFTPAGGGMEVGPFRLGETFSYEGKDFAVIGREGKKIQLRNLNEAQSAPFTVPVETPAPAAATP